MKNSHNFTMKIKGFASHEWGEYPLIDAFIYEITEPFSGQNIAVNFAIPPKSRSLQVAVTIIPEAGKRVTKYFAADLRKKIFFLFRTDAFDFINNVKLNTFEAQPLIQKLKI